MLSKTEEKFVASFLKNGFSRVPPAIANDVLKAAKLPATAAVKNVDHAAAEKIYHALQHAKLRNPPTDCLSPIGVRQILAGLLKGVKAEFYSASTRPPTVYRGMPFQIEVGLAFGGQIAGAGIENDKDAGAARLIRFANRVPLYQQSACSAFKAVTETAWKNYGLSQPRGSPHSAARHHDPHGERLGPSPARARSHRRLRRHPQRDETRCRTAAENSPLTSANANA